MLSLTLALSLLSPGVGPVTAVTLKDGDRVVFLGNTMVEREQRSGAWEMALSKRFADKAVTFRNLGWSGDTVWGDARAGFGDRALGFRELKSHVLAIKPTLVVVAYGANEAFAGEKGLFDFKAGLETLLKTLDESKARIVLVTPILQSAPRKGLPDPEPVNKNVRLYAQAIRETAARRNLAVVDLTTRIYETDNGIHLTEKGYQDTAAAIVEGLCGKNDAASVKVDEAKLRDLVVAKNELYFHRWRPQNVTYLFGFRKHEQGKNATDIPKFDPLVAAKEKEIREVLKGR